MALSFNARATENTISFGYAQSNVKIDGNNDKLDDPKGFNLKYRYEIDSEWGVGGALVHTYKGYSFYYDGNKGTADLDYYSLTVGPSYRFNEYVSAYGLIGVAQGKAKVSAPGYSDSESKTSAAYGAGLQFNPIPNVAIDASYEYSKLNDIKIGTWMVGLGYRF